MSGPGALSLEEEEEFNAIVERVFKLLDVERKGALDIVGIKVTLKHECRI